MNIFLKEFQQILNPGAHRFFLTNETYKHWTNLVEGVEEWNKTIDFLHSKVYQYYVIP